MPTRSLPVTSALALFTTLLFGVAAHAQDRHDWQKAYSVGAGAALTLETSDSAIDIRSCGDCRQIRMHSQSDDLTRFTLEEHQQGDHVFFSLKEKARYGFHINWSSHGTRVTVETPSRVQLEAKTSDGNVSVSNLSGSADLHSGDGTVTVDGFNGTLKISSSDGDLHVHNVTGSLEARTADGSAKVDGKFTAIQLHTSDGNLDLALSPGSNLTSASSVESSDGRVSVQVPHGFAASLLVSTSDGRIDCKLPLTVDHFDTRESSHSHLEGRLNSGTVPLNIHTSDGNILLTEI